MGLIIFSICFFLIIYHHIGYPLLLTFLTIKRQQIPEGGKLPLNKFIFIIPMYNEARYIAKKIANLSKLFYPKDLYEVWLIDDGSTDKTVELAQIAIKKHPKLHIKIICSPTNRGKVAHFNQMIPKVPEDSIVFFSDVSAFLSHKVLQKANSYFNNPCVGAYCTSYKLRKNEIAGEKYYWHYQNHIKIKESKLGTPIGYHGTGYAIRKSLWKKVPSNTINEDFVIPLQVIAESYCPNNKETTVTFKKKTNFLAHWFEKAKQGWNYFSSRKGYWGVYDASSMSIEQEISSPEVVFQRRIRLAAGNIQQVILLYRLLFLQQGWVAWMFFSGKVLRVFMPWFLLALFISNAYLAWKGLFIFIVFLVCQILFYLSGLFNFWVKTKATEITSYFIKGHLAMLLGWFYISQLYKTGRWNRANKMKKKHYIHPVVFLGKWLMDKMFALLGFLLLLSIGPIVAIIIKISSPGPIVYKQLRVGLGTEKQTKLFYLYKFRTMHVNGRFKSHHWTIKNDPRVFGFGRFMRKTHLDELPQIINILKGDMSLIGPRPERPSLFSYITKHIPYYQERLFEVRPGLTGLAQVTCPYDRTIRDVKRKVAFDHAYATYLTRPWKWFKTDVHILFKTIALILFGKTP